MSNKNRNEAILSGLHPTVADMIRRWLQDPRVIEHDPVLTSGYRSADEQQRLYNQGRTTPGSIVTNAKPGYSMHGYGYAADFLPKEGWGAAAIFDKLGKIAEEYGLSWGGRWEGFPDRPHLEYTGGLRITDLLGGARLPMPNPPKPSFANKFYEFSPRALARRLARLAKRV